MAAPSRFRVVLTADFYDADGQLKYRDIGLDLLGSVPHIEVSHFAEHRVEIEPQQVAGANGVIVLSSRVTARSLEVSSSAFRRSDAEVPPEGGTTNLLAIGRFGVGYDSVDVAACTAAEVVLFITAGAVDYSVAEATVGWMLA